MVNYVQVGQVVQVVKVVKVVQATVPHTRCDTFFKFDIWWKWPSKLSRYVYVGIWTSGPTQTLQFLSFVAKIRLTCELYPWCILSYHAMSLHLFSFSCAQQDFVVTSRGCQTAWNINICLSTYDIRPLLLSPSCHWQCWFHHHHAANLFK